MKLAEKSQCRMRHGAVIVRSGSVLAAGLNRDRNHPMVFDPIEAAGNSASTHAEMMALRKVRHRDLSNATIYVARINKVGQPMMSRPCNRCYLELFRAAIKEIVYTI